MSSPINRYIVPDHIRNERLDIIIAGRMEKATRSSIKNRIEKVFLNGKPVKLSKKVNGGDILEYSLSQIIESNITAENIKLDIVYEDENVIVINKPAGMVVHPAAGNYTGTLAQGLKYILQEEHSDFGENDTRPGIVHRLDKDTSGIIIAAKNTDSLAYLSEQFKERSASKTYLAVLNGVIPQRKGQIETLIGRDRYNRKKMTYKVETGKDAVTCYKVLKAWKKNSFVALYPKTGRTHQLRVHMLSMNAPIAGDPLYSRTKSDFGLMLHAYKLRIKIPGHDTVREFRAPLPDEFKNVILSLANSD
jgi:23S rRNA pseudouridine1911/1915/1917 synthase